MVITFVAGRLAGEQPEGVVYSPHPLAAISFLLAGAAIVPRQPRNAVGWLLAGVGFVTGAVAISGAFAEARLMMWFNQWLPPLAYGLLPPALLLFPDGRLPSRRFRYVMWLCMAAVTLSTIPLAWAAWVEPEIVFNFALRSISPVSTVYNISRLGAALIVPSAVAAVTALVWRAKKQEGETRQQVKLLAIGAAAIPFGIGLEIMAIPGSNLLVALSVPLAAALAMLKYRLYDVDLFLNRSLVYLILTTLLVAGYATSAALLGSALGAFGSPLVATGVVALAFQPLRAKVQQAVGRLLYGHRDDPYVVVSRLTRLLEPAMEPASLFAKVTEVIRDALRLPFVGVEILGPDGSYRSVVDCGRPIAATVQFPMVHDGRCIGRLVVSPRKVGGSFTTLERSLLQDLARQSGVALHALSLTEELRASRARLVRSREDERLRLRRELHDGVGPALAGAIMQVELALSADDSGRNEALGRLEHTLRGCLAEIRLIVRGLRPAALDTLGLPEALRRTSDLFASDGRFSVAVHGSAKKLDLPAAVEVAAYRIASEAITNAARHSGASRCDVFLRLDEDFTLEVVDDGRGLADGRPPGVGTSSMLERVEELGGSLSIQSSTQGTRVMARLPLDGR